LPHKYIILVSGSYNGNITPLLVSNSTMTIGSSNFSGDLKEYCLSESLLNPVVNIRPPFKNIPRDALLPS